MFCLVNIAMHCLQTIAIYWNVNTGTLNSWKRLNQSWSFWHQQGGDMQGGESRKGLKKTAAVNEGRGWHGLDSVLSFGTFWWLNAKVGTNTDSVVSFVNVVELHVHFGQDSSTLWPACACQCVMMARCGSWKNLETGARPLRINSLAEFFLVSTAAFCTTQAIISTAEMPIRIWNWGKVFSRYIFLAGKRGWSLISEH